MAAGFSTGPTARGVQSSSAAATTRNFPSGRKGHYGRDWRSFHSRNLFVNHHAHENLGCNGSIGSLWIIFGAQKKLARRSWGKGGYIRCFYSCFCFFGPSLTNPIYLPLIGHLLVCCSPGEFSGRKGMQALSTILVDLYGMWFLSDQKICCPACPVLFSRLRQTSRLSAVSDLVSTYPIPV
jgi:hypothetical protein